MARTPLRIEDLVPGGMLESDYVHVWTNDGSCSRCREQPPEHDVPLMLWFHGNRDLLIYCQACLGENPSRADDDD